MHIYITEPSDINYNHLLNSFFTDTCLAMHGTLVGLSPLCQHNVEHNIGWQKH